MNGALGDSADDGAEGQDGIVVEFAYSASAPPEPRLMFDPPPVLCEQVLRCGVDSCPNCGDREVFRRFRCVAIELGQHPHRDPDESVFRVGMVSRCFACGANVRVLVGLPREADMAAIGVLLGLPSPLAKPGPDEEIRGILRLVAAQTAVPPSAGSARAAAGPRRGGPRKGGRHGS